MSGFEDNFDPFASFLRSSGSSLAAQNAHPGLDDEKARPVDLDFDHFGQPAVSSKADHFKASVMMPTTKDHFGSNIRRESFGSPVSPSHSVNAKYLEIQGCENRTKIIIDHILQQREREFITFESFSLFVGTYNVNGQPPLTSMAGWLAESASVPPDIYAVGFQELDNSQQAFIFGTTPRESEWSKAVEHGLHPGATYFEVRRIRLIGMFLLIYAKESLRSKIGEIGMASVGTGLMNRMGNKGGVAVSMKVCDGTICFVCSHFAAHFDELDRRNMDFHQVSKLICECEMPLVRRTVYDHDIVVWLGDLNYRLQQPDGKPSDYDTVKHHCIMEDYMSILACDQCQSCASLEQFVS